MKYIRIVFILVAFLILGYTFLSTGVNTGAENKENYLQSILRERKEKDDFMKNDPESPFLKKGRGGISGIEIL
jgi:hypothetical protein